MYILLLREIKMSLVNPKLLENLITRIRLYSISSLFLLIMSTVCIIKNKQAYSHNFNTDDNSTFLTLLNQILEETRFVIINYMSRR